MATRGPPDSSDHLQLTLPAEARIPASLTSSPVQPRPTASPEGATANAADLHGTSTQQHAALCNESMDRAAMVGTAVTAASAAHHHGRMSTEAARARWRRVFLRLVAGQAASLAVASTGIFTTLLVNNDASVPALQSLFAYLAIAVVFVPIYVHRVIAPRWAAARHRAGAGLDAEAAAPSVAGEDEPTFAARLCARIGPRHFAAWRYLLIAAFDFTANTLAVWAYTYTDIISVQLLDCFTIPCVMALAYIVFKRRPQSFQLVGGVVAIVGLATLVLLDNLHDTTTGGASNPLLGDLLCLAASACYAVSNTACEALLKSSGPDSGPPPQSPAAVVPAVDSGYGGLQGRTDDPTLGYSASDDDDGLDGGNGLTAGPLAKDDADDIAAAKFVATREHAATRIELGIEYLTFVACFGAVLAGAACVVQSEDVANAMSKFDRTPVAFGQLGFAFVMVVTYSAMPALFAVASATFANLSLLSADIYAILLNLACFGRSPQPLFAVPFAVIIVGLIVYEGIVDWRKLRRRLCNGGSGRR